MKLPETVALQSKNGELCQWPSWVQLARGNRAMVLTKFVQNLAHLLAHATQAINMSVFDAATAQRSCLLYSVLASLLLEKKQTNAVIHSASKLGSRPTRNSFKIYPFPLEAKFHLRGLCSFRKIVGSHFGLGKYFLSF